MAAPALGTIRVVNNKALAAKRILITQATPVLVTHEDDSNPLAPKKDRLYGDMETRFLPGKYQVRAVFENDPADKENAPATVVVKAGAEARVTL